MNALLSGLIVAGYAVCGLFFFRFWRDTADRLFLIFGIAFWLLGGQRLLLLGMGDVQGASPYVYLIRLLAFSLILLAIVNKNRTVPAG
ncbi:MAG: hypothetical protein H0U67_04605 [Gemmatimonadetes bacterium]|nr:hypothetical protein [Gemmatimonadota bacterium]